MASKNFSRKQALEKEVKELYAKITIGASGAPTLVTASSKGFASVSRTSTGLYVLTLSDKYSKLLHARFDVNTPNPEDIHSNMVSETVATNKTITFRTCAGAIATDPASGDTVSVALQLKNTSV